MRKLFKILVGLTLPLAGVCAQAKTIHAVAFCNTLDRKIGEAAVVSHDLFNSEMSNLAYLLGYDFDFKHYVGEDCSKENLEKAISQISSTPEDIVVFYYFGHGTRAEGQESPFPQMLLKYGIYDQDKFMPVQYVINRLDKQPAHLKLIMSGCCNNTVGGVTPKNNICQAMGPTNVDGVNVDAFKKLFNDFSGTIAVTGSEPGQFSWCTSKYGGIFDGAFWAAMEAVGDDAIAPKWETVLTVVQQVTDKEAYANTDPPTHQKPYFQIKPSEKVVNVPDNNSYNKDRKEYRAPETNDDLQNAIARMISTPDRNNRLAQVNDIVNRFFNGNGGVIVQLLGRNMETVIETTDIENYLNSVALSDKILRVTNLGTTKINNIDVVRFHETRK